MGGKDTAPSAPRYQLMESQLSAIPSSTQIDHKGVAVGSEVKNLKEKILNSSGTNFNNFFTEE